MVKFTLTINLALVASLLVTVACAQAAGRTEDHSDPVNARILLAQVADSDTVEKPVRSRQQQELEEAIEIMRGQGVPEEQIEQFRRAAQSLVHMAPTDQENKKQRGERSAKRAKENSDRRFADATKIVITLGSDSYTLMRTVCKNEPGNFRVAGTGNDEGLTLRFSYARERLTNTLTQSRLRLNIGDRDVRMLDKAPWSYNEGAFWFADDVEVRTLFGPTSNRQQRTETMRLTIKAPC